MEHWSIRGVVSFGLVSILVVDLDSRVMMIMNLGGLYRTCLLGEEDHLEPGVMRPSGDLGQIDECGWLLYGGRCDRQVKRRGHRVNMDHIQQAR